MRLISKLEEEIIAAPPVRIPFAWPNTSANCRIFAEYQPTETRNEEQEINIILGLLFDRIISSNLPLLHRMTHLSCSHLVVQVGSDLF